MTDSDLSNMITWAPLSSYFYWSTYLENVSVGNVSLPLSVSTVVYDSGASLCYIPELEYRVLIKEITKGK